MDGARFLAPLLDFGHREQFEAGLVKRFGRGTHDLHRPNHGQFFLLATFRRYLFQLNEDSVALALQSCLGGSAPAF